MKTLEERLATAKRTADRIKDPALAAKKFKDSRKQIVQGAKSNREK